MFDYKIFLTQMSTDVRKIQLPAHGGTRPARLSGKDPSGERAHETPFDRPLTGMPGTLRVLEPIPRIRRYGTYGVFGFRSPRKDSYRRHLQSAGTVFVFIMTFLSADSVDRRNFSGSPR